MDVLINYHKDVQGKEVIDSLGNVIGKVNNISWDKSSREIKFFEISSGGIMEIFGRGEKKILPYDDIETIGDKILIKPGSMEPTKETIMNNNSISSVEVSSKIEDNPVVENDSNVKDRGIVTHTSRIKDISKHNISKVKNIPGVKDFSLKRDTKNIDKDNKSDDNVNIDDIEDTIEDFRIRNSF